MKKSIEASLTEDYKHPVRDVLWGHIFMTEKLAKLTASPAFIRLCRIFQLGPVYLTYPGASHTRASHSIGVYHIGRRLLQNLCERGASSWVSSQGAKSFLAACLLHDLGHFPYTHSLKELSLKSHESLTGAIILKEPIKNLVKNTGADPFFTAAIIDKDIKLPASAYSKNETCELHFYRKLLSGALDPDKLDYLNRDARYCGVPYGVQDVDFILSRLYPNKERGADIDSRLIPNVEAVLFSKYLMYRTVYWHHQVRAATAMIKKALVNGLEAGKITGEDLYGLDDQSLFTLLAEKTGDSLPQQIRDGKIYTTTVEIPAEKADFSAIRDIKTRSKIEEKLTAKTGAKAIIDIPEKISFETGLYVIDEKCNFNESSSAFKTEILNSFVKTLYIVRVFTQQNNKKSLKTFFENCDIVELFRGN